MTSETTQNIKSILLDISRTSGSDFLSLSESFPLLIEELESAGTGGTYGASEKMSEFEDIQKRLSETLSQQETLLEANKKFLSAVQKNNDELLATFSEKMQVLDTIHDIILGIKDESEEMEVISLNAMVVSIKSGRAGQAFSYITGNLKQMSLRLIKQSEELIQHGSSVQDSLAVLRSVIQKGSALDTETRSVSGSDNGHLLAASNRITAKISQIIGDANGVKYPILKAMEGIQMQDIIRQSLDDVLLAVDKLMVVNGSGTPEQQFEQCNTNAKLSLLSLHCLQKIKEKLDLSINVFGSNRDDANLILNQIEETRQSCLYARDGEKTDLEELVASIDNAIANFNSFADLIQSYQKLQSNVFDAVQQIQETVHSMYSCFTGFLPIISNLQYVAIAQRIEVARNEAISSIKDTVEHMADLILQTRGNVDGAQKQLEEFTEICNTQVKEFARSSDRDKQSFGQISKQRNTFSKALRAVQGELEDAINNFNVFSPAFMDKYESIGERLDSLSVLSANLEKACNMVEEIYQESSRLQEKLMKEHNFSDTDVRNQDMVDFLKRFTITENKLEAGSIEGISVSGGAESGEITFF